MNLARSGWPNYLWRDCVLLLSKEHVSGFAPSFSGLGKRHTWSAAEQLQFVELVLGNFDSRFHTCEEVLGCVRRAAISRKIGQKTFKSQIKNLRIKNIKL